MRGTRHLRELTRLAQAGQRTLLLYAVALSGIDAVRAAAEIDPDYAAALTAARAAGVEILAYAVDMCPAEGRLEISRQLELATN